MKRISITEMLGLFFVILKINNVITWSWWWVTVPFWGGYIILGIMYLIEKRD